MKKKKRPVDDNVAEEIQENNVLSLKFWGSF